MNAAADRDKYELDVLAQKPPQGTTWAVFSVLVIIARTMLRLERRMADYFPSSRGEDGSNG